MIVQAISLLDDIDKELNNYIMRTREWYGWHFPELDKILTDNIAYIKTILIMGKQAFNIDSISFCIFTTSPDLIWGWRAPAPGKKRISVPLGPTLTVKQNLVLNAGRNKG